MICIIKALQQVEVQEVNVVDEGLVKGDGFYFKKIDPITKQKIPFKDINYKKLKKHFKIYCK
jgi:hypothetical protein